ncbi:MAG: hypothetical protein V2A76_06815 [Planctomycetota bacterium]
MLPAAITTIFLAALMQAQDPPSQPEPQVIEEVEPDLPVKDTDKLRWIGSYPKALAEAKLRNVPVMVLLAEDSNTGLSQMLGKVFFQDGFANEAQDSIVPLIAMKGVDHAGEKRQMDGREVQICEYFDVPCEEHDQSFNQLWNGRVHRSYWGPIMILLRPDGSEILRIEGSEHEQARVLEEIGIAVEEVGKGLGDREYRKRMDRLVRARQLLDKGQVQKALKEVAVLRGALTAGFDALATREEERIDALGQAELKEAMALAGGEKSVRLTSTLREISRNYAGLPAAKGAQAALDDLKKKDSPPE